MLPLMKLCILNAPVFFSLSVKKNESGILVLASQFHTAYEAKKQQYCILKCMGFLHGNLHNSL